MTKETYEVQKETLLRIVVLGLTALALSFFAGTRYGASKSNQPQQKKAKISAVAPVNNPQITSGVITTVSADYQQVVIKNLQGKDQTIKLNQATALSTKDGVATKEGLVSGKRVRVIFDGSTKDLARQILIVSE